MTQVMTEQARAGQSKTNDELSKAGQSRVFESYLVLHRVNFIREKYGKLFIYSFSQSYLFGKYILKNYRFNSLNFMHGNGKFLHIQSKVNLNLPIQG